MNTMLSYLYLWYELSAIMVSDHFWEFPARNIHMYILSSAAAKYKVVETAQQETA